MSFTSLTFLYIFFPTFFLFYYITDDRLKNYWVLIASIFFYSWGSPKVVLILIFSGFLDYVFGRLIEKWRSGDHLKTVLAALSICANIGLLGYFKYTNFFFNELNSVVFFHDFKPFSWDTIVLPIGISFITFKKISYIVDVYRNTANSSKTFTDYLLYILIFPQIMAGPIARYHEFADQTQARQHSLELFFQGMFRFALGFGKKVLIADVLGIIVNRIFDMAPETLAVPHAWYGALCYTLQIYFDFSGYTDMAIGLCNMMGFSCPENFNSPYISRNITEFWRRWHITLSSWMREYLYIPLGGNRVSTVRVYLNLWIVFLASGLWHGANWTFIVWGAYHGLFIILDKVFWEERVLKMNRFISIAINFVIIIFGWVLFRSPDIQYACQYGLRMMGISEHMPSTRLIFWREIITNRSLLVFCIACVISFLPAFSIYESTCNKMKILVSENAFYGLKFLVLITITLLGIISLSKSNFNAFIYFRF